MTGICDHCQPQTPLTAVVAGAAYEGGVRRLVWQLKFQRLREAALPLAALLAPLLSPDDYGVITAVPVATARLRSRGYDQAELIARHLAARLRLPYRRLLVRKRTSRQVGKDRAARQREVEGVFAAISAARDQRILLVDDVITTGATVHAAALALKAAGAIQIAAAAAARDI